MNLLLEKISKSRPYYCHVIEVESVEELKNVTESIHSENIEEFSIDIILEFLESLTVYCLDDDNEEEVYNFSFTDYINKNL